MSDEKARRYIASLDTARANGNWAELPELIRKVTKHAPQQKCLIQTATLEEQIARRQNGSPVPSSTSENPFPPEVISNLRSTLESENQERGYVFQGQTCLGWANWVLAKPDEVVSALSRQSHISLHSLATSGQSVSLWTEICWIKAIYMKGVCQSKKHDNAAALSTFQTAGEWIRNNKDKIFDSAQLLYWSEQLLAQTGLTLSNGVSTEHFAAPDAEFVLQAFRHWAIFGAETKEVGPSAYGNSAAHVTRQRVWQAYYTSASTVLQSNEGSRDVDRFSQRFKQAAELRRVESSYEKELLRKVRFPKATEANAPIETWIEQVILNLSVLCGSDWREEELGQGGRNALGRNVLDILYRAAAKTFHSTLILRRLFQVHKFLTDFDVAYQALDTYIELIERGRARAAKSEEPSTGNDDDDDDDDTVLRTIAEGIEGLCAFGGRSEAEKAHKLSTKLESWVQRLLPESEASSFVNGEANGDFDTMSTEKAALASDTLGLVYRAIGIGQAHWARWTPFSEARTSLQAQAITNLKKAVSQETQSEESVKSLYALSFLLAERRDINHAIEYAKEAFAKGQSSSNRLDNFAMQTKLIPVWHLLALLLTARQDFETAGNACVAAFQQYPSPAVLFGSAKRGFTSKVVPGKDYEGSDPPRPLVDDMEITEKHRIIEIRMTEMALVELGEGPEEAVNAANDLLSLYSRMFNHLGIGIDDKSTPKDLKPPKSASATVKSTRASVFGRRKLETSNEVVSEKMNGVHSIPETLSRPTTQTTEAPTITVTSDDEKMSIHRPHVFRKSLDRAREDHRRLPKTQKRESSISRLMRPHSRDGKHQRGSTDASNQRLPANVVPSNGSSVDRPQHLPQPSSPFTTNASTQHTIDEVTAPATSLTSASSPQAKKALSNTADHMPDTSESTKESSTNQLPISDYNVRAPLEVSYDSRQTLSMLHPHLPQHLARLHALFLLAKIWLLIATLYRRAGMYPDSREAIDEAGKSAQKIESLIAAKESSARAFADPGWAGTGKSSDEVWADVFCEKAELAMAIAKSRGGNKQGEEEVGKGGSVDSEAVRDAVEQYEQCLCFFPEHSKGIIGLSNVLLDFYERKIELGRRVDDGRPRTADEERRRDKESKRERPRVTRVPSAGISGNNNSSSGEEKGTSQTTDEELKKTPENLNRLAARDRAYGLLSTLTKLGTGWDDAEAWFALARAHELGGELEKAKEILWWCVELEDRRPVRHWRNLGVAGCVL